MPTAKCHVDGRCHGRVRDSPNLAKVSSSPADKHWRLFRGILSRSNVLYDIRLELRRGFALRLQAFIVTSEHSVLRRSDQDPGRALLGEAGLRSTIKSYVHFRIAQRGIGKPQPMDSDCRRSFYAH